jgi:hypothetical protein
MARSTKLTDIQLILLSTAAQRPDGSLLPPPETLGDQAARIRRTIPPLIRRGLAHEIEVDDQARGWRGEGDRWIGVVITDAGRAAVSRQEQVPGTVELDQAQTPGVAEQTAMPPRVSKIARVTALLERADGASLADLVAATGWLPHTTRAALTGLRKKGHDIGKASRDGVTVYRIAAVS